jgi:DNA-binding NarL/FixJ family response regulator
MIEAGAEAYFNKSGSTHTLLSAIREVDSLAGSYCSLSCQKTGTCLKGEG